MRSNNIARGNIKSIHWVMDTQNARGLMKVLAGGNVLVMNPAASINPMSTKRLNSSWLNRVVKFNTLKSGLLQNVFTPYFMVL